MKFVVLKCRFGRREGIKYKEVKVKDEEVSKDGKEVKERLFITFDITL